MDAASKSKMLDQVDKNLREIEEAEDKSGTTRLTRGQKLSKAFEASYKAAAETQAAQATAHGKSMLAVETKAADKRFELEKQGAARRDASLVAEIKKAQARRADELKNVHAFALQLESVAGRVTGAISGLVSGAAVGGFMGSVVATANRYSNLQVQSQRTGSSPRSIQALVYALRKMGVDEGEANSALEGFSGKLRSNQQGFRNVLERIGVRTSVNGKDRDEAEVMADLGKYLSGLDYGVAKIQGGQLGLPENVIMALRRQAEVQAGVGEYNAKLGAFGLDPDKAAKDAREFDKAYVNLQADLKVTWDKIEAEFFTPLTGALNGLAKWLEDHPDIAVKFGEGLVAFSALMSLRVIPVVSKLLLQMTGLNAAFRLPAALASLLGVTGAAAGGALLGSTGPANANEPVQNPDGSASFTVDGKPATKEEYLADAARKKAEQARGPLGRLWDWGKSKLGIGGAEAAPSQGASGGILDMIRKGETGTLGPEGYDTITHQYKGTAPSTPISKMTVDQVLAFQKQMLASGVTDSAVGAYQINNATLEDFKRRMKLKGDETFDADLQTRMAKSIFASTGGDPGRLRGRWTSLNKQSDDAIRAAIGAGGGGDLPQDSDAVAKARDYLKSVASGGALRSDAISKLSPDFAVRAAALIKEARANGLSDAGLFSGYRKPSQTGSLYDYELKSGHSYGIAGDFAGIGRPGSPESRKFDDLARKYGFSGYGPDNPREWNHKELFDDHLQRPGMAKVWSDLKATLGPNGEMTDPGRTWAAVRKHLGGGGEPAPSTPAASPHDAYRDTLSPAMQKLYDAMGGAAAARAANAARLPHPAGQPGMAAMSIMNRGDTNHTFNQNVTVNGIQNPHEVVSVVKANARRGAQDYLRNMQGTTT